MLKVNVDAIKYRKLFLLLVFPRSDEVTGVGIRIVLLLQ
jgi:hypothetical protein